MQTRKLYSFIFLVVSVFFISSCNKNDFKETMYPDNNTQEPEIKEILIINETFEHTENLNGFKLWKYEDIKLAPKNWTYPKDFENGDFHIYFEIISQPTNRPCKLQFGFWQDDGERETMCDQELLNGSGSVVKFSTSPSTWWEKDYKKPVDFSRPHDFSKLGIPLWSDNTKLVVPYGANDWSLKDEYFPLKVRAIVVAVAKGETFSGWDYWMNIK